MSEITKWEYHEEAIDWVVAIGRMTELGKDGWEFCESIPAHGGKSHRFYYFKRPIK